MNRGGESGREKERWRERDQGRQVVQSVERRTLEVEARGSKPALVTWWWDRIPPDQPYPKVTAPAANTPLAEW